eukprot:5117204-Pleurochrysis_carterae.AAC.1
MAEKAGISWGCKCRGHVGGKGAKLRCRGCALWFHARCERLDYSPSELNAIAKKGKFECGGCERARLKAEGFDLSAGRFVYECRLCGSEFEDEHGARQHGVRCAARVEVKRWACPCGGARGGGERGASECA